MLNTFSLALRKTSKTMTKVAISVITALAIGACSENQTSVDQNQQVESPKTVSTNAENLQTLNELYDRAASTLFRERPLGATSAGTPEDLVGADIHSKVPDYSPETEAKLRQDLATINKQISAFPSASLTETELENKKVMQSVIRYFSGNPEFSIGYIDVWMGLSPFIVNQINGPIMDSPRALSDAHQVNSEQDGIDYINRLNSIDQLISNVEAKFIADTESGWIPPKVILQGAIEFIDRFTQIAPEKHGLVSTFTTKLEKLTELSEEQRASLIKDASIAVQSKIYPAYQKLAETVAKTLEIAPNDSGIWAQPRGSQFYQDAILQLGDSNLSADEIHQLGLDEVSRIATQMNQILIEQGYKDGSVGERMVKLSKEPRFLYEDSDAGRAQLISDVNGFIKEMTDTMSPLFKTKPAYEVEVRSFPVETQDSMPGGQYSPPPLDGSIPGIYWINLRDMEAVAKFTLKTLTYHEANPGHHWQISIALEQKDASFLRLVAPYNAFIEGWALYSEQIAEELGMYKDDPFSNLGRLQDELFRAVRLVVDTGLHHKKWSREKAITYMMDITGTPESSCKAEIERYMTWPGQALGYKLGMLKILELRELARNELGETFDIAEFHDIILTGGAVPMSVLDAKIKRWVASLK